MKKLFVIGVILAIPFMCFADDAWKEGADNDVIASGDSPSDIDTLLSAGGVEPLERLLKDYKKGCEIEYSSASALTVGDGQVAVQDSSGDVVAFLSNSSDTEVTWSDIDTGSEASATRYYVYAYSSGPTSDLDFDVAISTNSTSPSGISYYQKIGDFYNDSSSNITDIHNYGFFSELGQWESKSADATYQATTDGFVTAEFRASVDNSAELRGYTDSSSSPTTIRDRGSATYDNSGGHARDAGVSFPVKEGDYWKVLDVETEGNPAVNVYWLPLERN